VRRSFPPRTIAAIAVGYLAGVAAYSSLPGPYLAGREFAFARPAIAWFLPTTAVVVCGLFGVLWRRDPLRRENGTVEGTFDAILFRLVLFLIALHALILVNLVGLMPGRGVAGRSVLVLFGLLLIGVGNLLPRTRPNIILGLRTARTLTDRALWIRMHRLGGYLLVALGAIVVVAGALLSGPMMHAVVGPCALFSCAVFVVSYRRLTHS
jgi:uncharacterized membrane protein